MVLSWLWSSNFEIDADIVFLQSPTDFFTNPLYLENGALFFKDRTIPVAEKKKYKLAKSFLNFLFPVPSNSSKLVENRLYQGTSQHEQESGFLK